MNFPIVNYPARLSLPLAKVPYFRPMNLDQWIADIARHMQANEGPFTRKQLAEAMDNLHPGMSRQQLMNAVSCAIEEDKGQDKLFAHVKQGWWDLAKRNKAV